MRNRDLLHLTLKVLIILSACGVLVLTLPSWAFSSGPGETGAEILNFHPSARAAALGDAFSGASGGLESVLYNPAALIRMERTEFEFSHMFWFLDTSMSSAGVGHRVGPAGVGAYVKQFRGSDTRRDIFGEREGGFDIRFTQYTLAAGYPTDEEEQSVGAAVNLITETMGDESGSAFSFDFGWHYRMWDGMSSYGLVARNIGGGIKTAESEADLPREIVFGGRNQVRAFEFLWEISTSRPYGFCWRSGISARMGEHFTLRAGFKYILEPEYSAGFGVQAGGWILDYAFFPHLDLGISHRISIGARL